MAWKRSALVVADVTASSGELVDALKGRTAGESTTFTLVVPATGGRAAAVERLAEALDYLRDQGLEVEGSVGHPDPLVAVIEAWDPGRHDEVIVATLPADISMWLHAGLPHRIEKLTGAPVSHVISRPPRPPVQVTDNRVARAQWGCVRSDFHSSQGRARRGGRHVHHPRRRRSPSTRSSTSPRRTHQAANRWCSSTAYGCYPAAGTDGPPSSRRLGISRSPPVGPTTRRR